MRQDSTDPTGILDTTPRGNSEVTRARERKANAALQLRGDHYTWDSIAEVLGYPTGRAALVATEKALEDRLASVESKQFVREVLSRQIEKMLKSVMPRASLEPTTEKPNPEHLAYVDRAIKLIDSYARLHGANAPTEFVVTNPSAAEIERWVSEVTNADLPDVTEADIFATVEGEVVPDAAPAQ